MSRSCIGITDGNWHQGEIVLLPNDSRLLQIDGKTKRVAPSSHHRKHPITLKVKVKKRPGVSLVDVEMIRFQGVGHLLIPEGYYTEQAEGLASVAAGHILRRPYSKYAITLAPVDSSKDPLEVALPARLVWKNYVTGQLVIGLDANQQRMKMTLIRLSAHHVRLLEDQTRLLQR